MIRLGLICICLILSSCTSPDHSSLKVAASSVPHAEMLEFIQPDLHAEGIELMILVIDDYNMPNRALAEGEIDANFFQHLPFLEEQIRQFHYPIVNFAKVELEPMGIYSEKYRSLSEVQQGAKVAIPNDPTNEGRALFLLEQAGLIGLDQSHNLQATLLNIVDNPRHLQFIEVDAALLPRSLSDLDLAVINTNYALQAGLSPKHDALLLEGSDSPYVNVLAIRAGDEGREDLQTLKELLTSKKMQRFLLEKYEGAVIPSD